METAAAATAAQSSPAAAAAPEPEPTPPVADCSGAGGGGGSGKSDAADAQAAAGARLLLPSDCPKEWKRVVEVLSTPIEQPADLDAVQTKFGATDQEPRVGKFFGTVPGTAEAGKFNFQEFFEVGAPLMVAVALEMPALFAGVELPILKTRSAWGAPAEFVKRSVLLSRRQCACLLAHSFFGSLKRPADVQPNNFRFTVVDLFIGTAITPNSATTFLNYFTVLGRNGIPEDEHVIFERQGYCKGPAPWVWDHNEKPLCEVELTRGSIDDCQADYHVEFANCFPGGGVMSGDAAQEEMLFLVKPELMVAMALMNRVVDEEVVTISGAVKYSLTSGFGQTFEFDGDYDGRREGPPPKVVAIDAIRGGGPAMTTPALLRDMNKARVAFEGARELGTGHWGCGAFGNNHDLMFLKQWLAASEAGVTKMYYHDFDRKQSHSIFPLIRKMKHLTVGELWAFVLELTQDLASHDVASFSKRIVDIALGRLPVPGAASAPTTSTRRSLGGKPPTSTQLVVTAVNVGDSTVAAVTAAMVVDGAMVGGASTADANAVLYKGVDIDSMSFVALRAACTDIGLKSDDAKPRLLHRLRASLQS